MKRTPVALVTGFLGSGKTTLINRLLRHPGMADSAVIVNEFGAIGLDHHLIAASDDAVVLLENGCLCCAVRGDLVRTLDELHRKRSGGTLPPFARVLIETSGLADPGPVIQALLGEPTLRARYALGGVIAVVDAVNGPATLDASVEALKQVAVADSVVLTKLELTGSQRAAGAREAMPRMPAERCSGTLADRLAAINPGARIVASPAQPEPALFFDARTPADDPAAVFGWLAAERHLGDALRSRNPTRPRHDDRVRSCCVVRDEPIAEATLGLFIDALSASVGPGLLRIKGLIAVAERPDTPAVLHGAQSLMHELSWLPRWPSADRRTRIVVITLDRDPQEIQALLGLAERMAAGAARARARSSSPGGSPTASACLAS